MPTSSGVKPLHFTFWREHKLANPHGEEAPAGLRVARPDVIGCILSQTLRMKVEGRI
jgi:hypothetical protein